MPGLIESFVFSVLISNVATIGIAGSAAAIAAITGAVSIGLSVGLSYLSSQLFKPQQPKPEDVQTSVRNPTAPRVRHYGRVKISGPWVFAESKDGDFHKVIALGTGELDAIEEIWVDDNLATFDGSGLATSEPYHGGGGTVLRVQTRLGLPTETHYSSLASVFPEWTSSHRGDGVSSLYAKQFAMDAQYLSSQFPNLTQTLFRAVARGSKVYNPSTETTIWSDNAAAVIRDYLTHPDGMRLPEALMTTTQAADGWLAAYNLAATAIALKEGGSEAKYRLWGSYRLDERPADVLGRMLASCDGKIVPTPDGGVTLDIGNWVSPAVTLDADAIAGFEVSHGRDILTTANTISATYTSPMHDYQAADADRWSDEDDISLRGEIVQDIALNMTPSHGQARRLMKLASYRANPNWIGSFQCNLRALAAFGERFVRITYPLFDIDEVFEVLDFRFNIGEGGILTGVTVQVQSMPSTAYAWNAEDEEGAAPARDDTDVDRSIPDPTGFTFDNGPPPFGVLAFDLPPASLFVQAQYKLVSDSVWIAIPVATGATTAQTPGLTSSVEYEAQIRYVSLTGRVGDWTPSEMLTPP